MGAQGERIWQGAQSKQYLNRLKRKMDRGKVDHYYLICMEKRARDCLKLLSIEWLT